MSSEETRLPSPLSIGARQASTYLSVGPLMVLLVYGIYAKEVQGPWSLLLITLKTVSQQSQLPRIEETAIISPDPSLVGIDGLQTLHTLRK